jgi:uncharacterized protein
LFYQKSNKKSRMAQKQNRLADSDSPYLQQHANNPVNWYPWGDEALNKAKQENKLIIISIGYAACHWCHVMERECFEDNEVAEVMNANYVNIKVDREERPDVDHIYMDALQIMSGQGGWPLNIVALSDARPVFGGTYFPKDKWISTCKQLADMYHKEPNRFIEFAEKLTEGLKTLNLTAEDKHIQLTQKDADEFFENLSENFDEDMGGTQGAPKFPMPDIYRFLLYYYAVSGNENAKKQALLTLNKMHAGGIYDHLGGGLSRYSTDAEWGVPHFEKMLYDNAQLISLYSEAYRLTNNSLYKTVIQETIDFVVRELSDTEPAYFSALDADSEGEEGRYYLWEEDEIEKLLKADAPLAKKAFGINDSGYREKSKFVLSKQYDNESLASTFSTTPEEIKKRIESIRETLFKARSKRVRPAQDDKVITSWNALMLSAFCDAYRACGQKEYLEYAGKLNKFIAKKLRYHSGLLRIYKKGKSGINAFLEDYACYIHALIDLYEISFEAELLIEATALIEICNERFSDENECFYYFTDIKDEALIARKIELTDQVIGSSNAIMAECLFKLSKLTSNIAMAERSARMLKSMMSRIKTYPPHHSRWGTVLLMHLYPYYELVICGQDALQQAASTERFYFPNKVMAGSQKGGDIPEIIKDRFQKDKTRLYLCRDNSCLKPVDSYKEVLQMAKVRL